MSDRERQAPDLGLEPDDFIGQRGAVVRATHGVWSIVEAARSRKVVYPPGRRERTA